MNRLKPLTSILFTLFLHSCSAQTNLETDIIGVHEKRCDLINLVETVEFTADSVFYSYTDSHSRRKWKGTWKLRGTIIDIVFQQPVHGGGFMEDYYDFEFKKGVLSSRGKTEFIGYELYGIKKNEVKALIRCMDGSFKKK